MSKKINQPSEHDLEVWRNVNQDLMDWLYSGLTGKFQLRERQVIVRYYLKNNTEMNYVINYQQSKENLDLECEEEH